MIFNIRGSGVAHKTWGSVTRMAISLGLRGSELLKVKRGEKHAAEKIGLGFEPLFPVG